MEGPFSLQDVLFQKTTNEDLKNNEKHIEIEENA